uniref:RNA helicase n=1 Tax=Globodera pallida TaxID=36090 RepID=A0A183BJI8_GLOPA
MNNKFYVPDGLIDDPPMCNFSQRQNAPAVPTSGPNDSWADRQEQNKRAPMTRAEMIRRQKYELPTRSIGQLVSEQNEQKIGPDFERQQNVQVTVRGGAKNDGDQYLISSFDEVNLSEQIEENLRSIRFRCPTAVQRRVIPLILQTNEDLRCLSSTGTGKTGAFLIPIIARLEQFSRSGDRAAAKRRSPKAIIVAHTKELVQQIGKAARIVAKDTGVGIVVMMGSVHYQHVEAQITREGCDVLVSTPGRLRDYIANRMVDLDCLQFLVIDEMDKFFSDTEFVRVFHALKEALDQCGENKSRPCRTLMFSATLDSEEIVEQFLRANFYHVEAGVNQSVSHVQQIVISATVRNNEKAKKLQQILLRDGGTVQNCTKTVIFLNECRRCDRIAIMLAYYGYRAISINGHRTLEQRSNALAQFNAGEYDVLVGTDIIARGMNIPNLTRVILYELPPIHRYEQYVHRVGRVGRMGNVGEAFVFFNPEDPNDMQMAVFLRDQLRSADQQRPKWLDEMVQSQQRFETEVQQHVEQEMQSNTNFNSGPCSIAGGSRRGVQELDEDQDDWLYGSGFANSDWR